jgi:hypothetical protein
MPAAQARQVALALGERLTLAYRRRSWPGVDSLLADDYLGVAPGVEWDRAALRHEFPNIRLESLRSDSAIVRTLGPGVLLLDEDATMRESYAGEDISGRYRLTTAWVLRAGQWKLAFEQEIPLLENRVP